MPDVRLPRFRSSKSIDAHLVRSAITSDTSLALRFSASPTHRRHRTLVVGRGRFSPSGVAAPSSAFPSGGVKASFPAQLTTSQLQGLRRSPSTALPSFPHQAPPPEPGSIPSFSGFVGVQTPRFTRAAQHPHSKRAASQVAPELPSPPTLLGSLTPACSGLAALAADARR